MAGPRADRSARRPAAAPRPAPPAAPRGRMPTRRPVGRRHAGRPANDAGRAAPGRSGPRPPPAPRPRPRSPSAGAATRAPRRMIPRPARSVVVAGVGGFDLVLLHQLAEVLAVDVGVAGGVRDVAGMALEQRQDVVALEAGHPALLGVLEGHVAADQLVG